MQHTLTLKNFEWPKWRSHSFVARDRDEADGATRPPSGRILGPAVGDGAARVLDRAGPATHAAVQCQVHSVVRRDAPAVPRRMCAWLTSRDS